MMNSSNAAALDSSKRRESDSTASTPIDLHSLGEALAGVTLGSSATASFGSSYDPIARADSGSCSGWGNFTATDINSNLSKSNSNGAFTTLSGSNNNSHQQNDDLALFLSQDPSKSLGESVLKLSNSSLADLHKDPHHQHLSQAGTVSMSKSESQSSFRMLNSGNNNIDLRETLAPTTKAHTFGADGKSQYVGARVRESPVCSATGTTASSRSGSPFSQGGYTHHTSNSYDHYSLKSTSVAGSHRYGTPPMTGAVFTDVLGRSVQSPHHNLEDDRSMGGYSLPKAVGSHPSLATLDSQTPHLHRSSPYGTKEQQHQRFRSNNTSPFETPKQHSFATTENNFSSSALQLPTTQDLQTASPQPQVLYMAVPSPDGRGQVLQPVQMMQMPGKPYHFVANGSLPEVQQQTGAQLVTGTTAFEGSNGNSMMVLPPLQDVAQLQQAPFTTTTNYQASQHSTTSRPRLPSYGSDAGGLVATTSNQKQSSSDVASLSSANYEQSSHEHVRSHSASNSRASSPFLSHDPSLAALYGSTQRPPLESLLGQVRRLFRDQVGCRLVQQTLDEEGPSAATSILNEGLPFWGEAMIDPFGNYMFQKVLEKISSDERIILVKSVGPRLVNASLNLHGTRSVQKVVEVCALDEESRPTDAEGESAADILARTLGPAAARLCIDSHGNHVIQRVLLKFGPKHTQFVFDAVAANIGDVARHRHGCCVIQRCLDSPAGESRNRLIRRIVENSLELMQDAYGNYVVQYVLDVCPDEDVHAVCENVVGKVTQLAVQKFSSNVMEKCFERCPDRVREQYMHEMCDPDRIREIMMDPFGNYVVQRALAVATHAQAISLVEAMRLHLTATQTIGPQGQRNGGVRNTAGGRRIIAKICRRFPHFTLSEDIVSEHPNMPKTHGQLRHYPQQQHQQPYHHMLQHQQQPPMPYHQPPHLTSPYASIGPPSLQQPFYLHDPRMATPPGFLNMPVPPIQHQHQSMPSYYNMGDGSNHYFDHQQQQQFGGGYLDM